MASDHFTRWTEEAKAAYAAGIIDGEGTIGLPATPKGKGFRLYVQVGLSVKGWPVLEFLKNHFGARLYNARRPSPQRSLIKICAWSGIMAEIFLRTVRPFLLAKHKQTDLALEFQSFLATVREGKRCRWTDKSFKIAAEYALKMKFLNERGSSGELFPAERL